MLGGVGDLIRPLTGLAQQLTDPLMATYARNAGIIAGGGAITPTEAAGLNAPLTAQLAQAGMGRSATAPFLQGMNTYNEMQRRVDVATGRQNQGAGLIQAINTAIPAAIQSLQGTALQGALTTEGQTINDFLAFPGALAGPIANQIALNQAGQFSSNVAGANKNAGIETGIISALGNIASSAVKFA
jgi:hypothetical protein